MLLLRTCIDFDGKFEQSLLIRGKEVYQVVRGLNCYFQFSIQGSFESQIVTISLSLFLSYSDSTMKFE